VRTVTSPPAARARATGVPPALFFTVVVILVVLDQLPVILLVGYGLLSAIAFLTHRADESAAQQGRWRTPESTLHAIDLVGGGPQRAARPHRPILPPVTHAHAATRAFPRLSHRDLPTLVHRDLGHSSRATTCRTVILRVPAAGCRGMQ
jgi:hypothetical protein